MNIHSSAETPALTYTRFSFALSLEHARLIAPAFEEVINGLCIMIVDGKGLDIHFWNGAGRYDLQQHEHLESRTPGIRLR